MKKKSEKYSLALFRKMVRPWPYLSIKTSPFPILTADYDLKTFWIIVSLGDNRNL